jgi:predicted ATPase
MGSLVTLTGPGGSGKTRLALQAAAELSEEFLDGTFFVGLAPLRDTHAVRSAVAQAVGMQSDDDIVGWLGSRRVLLVLDNLEHLGGVAAIVRRPSPVGHRSRGRPGRSGPCRAPPRRRHSAQQRR